MTASHVLTAAQLSWLTLCAMMIVSRFVFRNEGPVGMRRFLDAWKTSRTHRLWGVGAGLWGLALAVGLVARWSGLGALDVLVVGSVIFVLVADGLLNLTPSGFANFKERMQDAWVRRHEGGERASDAHLFGTVNLLLGLASAAVTVYVHRPLPLVWLAGVVIVAVALTAWLIGACKREAGLTRGATP